MKYLYFLLFSFCFSMYLGNHTGFNIISPGTEETSNRTNASTTSSLIDFSDLPGKAIRTTRARQRETPRIGTDSSMVETISDSYGNKIETRAFYNDELLKLIVVRTSADGQKQALIYGQNGEIKLAPLNILNNVLALSAAEIARTVQIFEGRPEIKTPATIPNDQTLNNQTFIAAAPTANGEPQINEEVPPVEESANNIPPPTIAEQIPQTDKISPETIKVVIALSKNNLSAKTLGSVSVNQK